MRYAFFILAWFGWFGSPQDPSAWLYKEGGRTWIELEFDGGTVAAQDARSVVALQQSLNFYVPELRKKTSLDASSLTDLKVFSVSDENLWRRTLARVGPREDGVAFSLRHNLFLYEPRDQQGSPMRLPHELVHILLQNSQPLPLWLEEGLACFWSVELVQARHQVVGTSYNPQYPRFDQTDPLIPWDRLFSAKQIPADVVVARSFYAQSETAVRLLKDLAGEEALIELIQRCKVARPDDDVLKDFFDDAKLDRQHWLLAVEQELFRGSL